VVRGGGGGGGGKGEGCEQQVCITWESFRLCHSYHYSCK